MERYGIAYIAPSGEKDALRVENKFFKSMKDCMQTVITCGEIDKYLYFKILKNSEIVSLIHKPAPNSNFGYIYVTARPGEQLDLLSHTNKLYDNLLECITDRHVEKCYTEELSDTDMRVKIAYFKILKDCDIVSQLHRSCVWCECMV